MNHIGTLTRTTQNKGATFLGEIRTLELELMFWLKIVPGFPNVDGGPEYRLWTKDRSGASVAIGHGWINFLNEEDDPDEVPIHTIKMEIDDPSFPYPLITEAYKPFEKQEWHIAWHRQMTSPFEDQFN